MMAVRSVEVRRYPGVSPAVAAVCVAALLWAFAIQRAGYATRYPAVPISFVTFLAVQVLVPRVRWNRDRVLGPGNVAAMLFFLQLVILPTALVFSGPFLGTLRFFPANQYVNTAVMLQALAYVCYAGGYVAYSKPVQPRPLLLKPGLSTGIAVLFIVLGAVGLGLAFPSVGALVDYFSGHGNIFEEQGPATLAAAAGQFLRPFLAYGVIILWAARIARRRPGARLQPFEIGLIVIAIAASATYNYNRGSVVVPLLALVTAYSCFGRRQSPTRIVVLLALLAAIGFLFGEYRDVYSGTRGGEINPAAAGMDQPAASFADNVQGYGNGPQFWAVVIQEVDRTGMRYNDSIVSSVMFPVPVLGKSFRNTSGPTLYNELIYGEPDIRDQNLPLGAELYWNFGVPGIVVGYFLLGFAIRRLDDRIEVAPDALASYTWSYCGIWVALLIIHSISVLAQMIVYFFWPMIAMVVVAYLTGSRTKEVQS
ncbi:MAG: hypothetical protein JWN96_699 [Mycobacterium sp.]|nr:hypothetical protein [Mycobacterium sp.]